MDLCTSYSERPNLLLYRDRFAVHKELHSKLQGEGPARWPRCLSWHILMWLSTMNGCCPVVTMQHCAGLGAASLEALWTLQYCVMAWEFILNTAISGEGKVSATRMGASAICQMRNHDQLNSSRFSALYQSHYNVWTWTVQSKQCIFLSKTILDKSLFGKLKPAKQVDKYKNSMSMSSDRQWQGPGHGRAAPSVLCSPQKALKHLRRPRPK